MKILTLRSVSKTKHTENLTPYRGLSMNAIVQEDGTACKPRLKTCADNDIDPPSKKNKKIRIFFFFFFWGGGGNDRKNQLCFETTTVKQKTVFFFI